MSTTVEVILGLGGAVVLTLILGWALGQLDRDPPPIDDPVERQRTVVLRAVESEHVIDQAAGRALRFHDPVEVAP